MNVLAIGAAGFVGLSAISRLYETGHKVRIADTRDRLLNTLPLIQNYEQVVLDWPDTQYLNNALEGIDVVLHFAWTTSPASSMRNIEADAMQNILPSIKLAEACVEHRVNRLIFMSSGGTVYGNVAEEIIDESHVTSPLCAYGVSKLSVEKYLYIFSKKHNLDTISLRISNPYGNFQLLGSKVGAIASFLRHTHKGKPINLFGDGGTVRDYLHIDDVSKAIALAVEMNTMGAEVFNISSGIGYSLQDTLDIIKAVSGKEIEINRLEERRFDVRHIVLSSKRFQNTTGWQPQIELPQGIAMMWKYLQKTENGQKAKVA
ncbi:MAG: NAD-dependent epimerase/dehydratase family protein [Gammaproteobacteria bacterium]|nr:NAD-dependent epimerase/dehydratase family protein [Gammaproteobacteria bacterium]